MTIARSILFWLHLAAGSVAGVVILIMSVTGVALTYEKQIVEWADRRAWTPVSAGAAEALSPETLLTQVRLARPAHAPVSLTIRADRSAPATVTLTDQTALLVDPYTGLIIGAPPTRIRGFFRTMTAWHRYLARDGASRSAGKSVTGAANLAFLFLVISGLYLWVPRVWTWLRLKQVLWFRSGLTSKARDFNWHHVIGVWTAIPLAIVVAGAVPISYPWASNLVYRLAGDTPPPANVSPRSNDRPVAYVSEGIDAAWSAARARIPEWRTMHTRLASTTDAPVVIAIDEGYGGQPQKRTTFTVERANGLIQTAEGFQNLGAGRRLRSWLRFAHTGEIYGLIGQTVAGVVSLGGAVLVFTGLSLAVRRLGSWIGRKRDAAYGEDRQRAA